MNPAEDGIATPEGDPTIHHELSPWGGSKGRATSRNMPVGAARRPIARPSADR